MYAKKSETINELAKALSSAQSEIRGAIKDSKNPFFNSKYADLESVWSAIREPLTKHGLSVIQTMDHDVEVGIIVVTTLAHTSGQWIEGGLPIMAVKKDPQGMGSAITYARRYALAAITGVVQVDDDGNAATTTGTNTTTLKETQKATNAVLSDPGEYVVPFSKKYKGKRLNQLTADEIQGFVDWLKSNAKEKGEPLSAQADEFVFYAEGYLGERANEYAHIPL